MFTVSNSRIKPIIYNEKTSEYTFSLQSGGDLFHGFRLEFAGDVDVNDIADIAFMVNGNTIDSYTPKHWPISCKKVNNVTILDLDFWFREYKQCLLSLAVQYGTRFMTVRMPKQKTDPVLYRKDIYIDVETSKELTQIMTQTITLHHEREWEGKTISFGKNCIKSIGISSADLSAIESITIMDCTVETTYPLHELLADHKVNSNLVQIQGLFDGKKLLMDIKLNEVQKGSEILNELLNGTHIPSITVTYEDYHTFESRDGYHYLNPIVHKQK